MSDPIEAPPSVFVPPAAIEVHAVRSAGPGGQNVNKVASKILLVVDLSLARGLEEIARRRLATLAGRRLGADGKLRITAQESRDRHRNLETAYGKARELLVKAQIAPKARRPTRPGAAAKEQRLKAKKRDAVVKAGRRDVAPEE